MKIQESEDKIIQLFKSWLCKAKHGYQLDYDDIVKDIGLLELIKQKRQLQCLYDELKTVIGSVGLDSDGSYSVDQTTTYINQSQSILDALKTIDDILASHQEQIDNIPIWNEVS